MIPDAVSALGWLVKLTAILAAALGVARLLRRSASVVRYRIWFGALCAVLIGPLVAGWVNVKVPVWSESLLHATAPATNLGAAPITAVAERALERQLRDMSGLSAVNVAAALWVLVAIALLTRLLWSAASVRRIISHGRQLTDQRWTNLLYETADRMGLESVPVLFSSGQTSVPLACRLHRPAIVLPLDAESWSEERLRAVLLHELAHVKRRDLIGHTLSRVLCALYWFHPLVWTAARRLRAESERACDDLALRGGARPSEYAQQLLSMVAELRTKSSPATAMAMSANREFEGRIVSILDPRVARQPRNSLHGVVPMAAVVAIGLMLAVSQPAARAAAVSIVRRPTQSTVAALPRDSAALARLLRSDPSSEVRVSVAWALHERPETTGLLATAFQTDPDPAVREMSVWALGQIGDTTVLPVIYGHLPNESAAAVRATSAWAIGQLRGPPSPALLRLLSEPDVNVVRMAVWAVGQSAPEVAPTALLDHLRHPDLVVRQYAAVSTGDIADPASIPPLQAALVAESEPIVRLTLFRALFECGDRSPAFIEEALQSTDPEVRRRGAQVLTGQKPQPWSWIISLPDPRPID